MANLTRTSFITRQAVKYGAVVFVLIIILRSLTGMFKAYYRARHPLPPPAPTVAFGQLPKLEFGESRPKPQKELVLETISGDLPKLPDQIKAYFIPALVSRFLALEKTNQIAQNLGFAPSPEKVSNDLYRYKNEKVNTTLTINPLTKTFLYSYPYLKDQTLATLPLPLRETLVKSAFSFLEELEQEIPDLGEENARVTLWQIKEEKTIPAVSISEAHLAQIDFFRRPIEGQYPILPQTLDRANVSLVLSGDSGKRKIVEARYTYFFVDLEKAATYPLKPLTQAWEEVKEGNYHLVKFNSGVEEKTIPIRKVYLAYFDPHYPTNFLQPIFVFEGDYGFTAFVSAISTEWVAE
ncbi:hypothetical protein ISS42_02080 [Candidatus Shapirobacteria bacterium]|nr:hypothetical protein [Candidatus Shapirobacteria bacterium]